MTPLHALLTKSLRSGIHAGRVLKDHSRLKVAVIGSFTLLWCFCFWLLFDRSFEFLHSLGGAGYMLIPRLFNLFFFGLGMMMCLSGAITAYAALYQSRETRRLLAYPIGLKSLVTYKFLESTLLSSWAFFFVILPFIAAYATYRGFSIFLALWALVLALPFVMICTGIGMLIVMLLVRFAPRGRYPIMLALAMVAGLVLWASVYMGRVGEVDQENTVTLLRMIPGLKVAAFPLLPSWWMSEGLLTLTRGEWGRGALLFCTSVSTLGVLILLLRGVGTACFYEGYLRENMGRKQRADRSPVLSTYLPRLLPLPMGDTRAILLKDIRIFLRDPAQWTQVLLFFGLLGFYFSNLRNLGYDQLATIWRNLIGFLNVFSLSAVMCSISARFVYPLMSQEAHGIWVVGLAPTSLPRLMMSKFVLALTSLWTVGLLLAYTSSSMLDLPPRMIAATLGLASVVAICHASLSIALGAIFIDPEPKPPTVIISGFGGTLNLILCLLVVLLVIFPPAILMHLGVVGQIRGVRLLFWTRLLYAYLALLVVLCSVVPLRHARRVLLTRDY